MSRSVSVASGSVWVFYLYPSREGETSMNFGQMEQDWDDFIEDIQNVFIERFPSLSPDDKWLDREDHAILGNNHAWIGVSEYNGLVSLWAAPRNGELSEAWCAQIENSVEKLLDKCFPSQRLVKQGTFSNGEAVFAPVGRPGGCVTSKEGVL